MHYVRGKILFQHWSLALTIEVLKGDCSASYCDLILAMTDDFATL